MHEDATIGSNVISSGEIVVIDKDGPQVPVGSRVPESIMDCSLTGTFRDGHLALWVVA